MNDILPFLVAGVVVGSLYGLAATGLVLTYKTSGIFNFAHGAVGAATAYLFYELRDVRGLPGLVALVAAVLIAAPLLGLVLSRIAARLRDAPVSRRVVATVGVLLVLQGLVQWRYGIVPIPFETPLPSRGIELGGTFVGVDQMITIALAMAVLIALRVLFRRSRLGLEMRAVVQNDALLDLSGGAPTRVRAISWMLGAAFAGLSGVLLAPTVQLDALLLTLLVVQAFGAAAVGRFESLPLTFLGGVAIGVVQYLLRAPDIVEAIPGLGLLEGLDQSVSFLALFGVLLLYGQRLPTAATTREVRRGRPWPQTARAIAVMAAIVLVLAAPLLAPARAPILIQGAVFVTIFASLYLLVEVSGQISLAHVAFVAVGATTFAHMTTGLGLPWGVGLVIAALVAIPVGAVVAVPAIRVSGLFLALATLGFGILVEQMLYTRPLMFGVLGQRFGDRPAMFGLDSDIGYFYLCAVIGALMIGTVVAVRRGRLGRLLNALADEPVALATHGASPNTTRVLVFCIAAAMAAVGGAMYVGVVGSVSSSGVSPAALVSFNSLLWLAVLAFSGRNPVISPVVASVVMIVAPSFAAAPDLAQYLTVGFGLAALLTAVYGDSFSRWLDARWELATMRVQRSPVSARLQAGTDSLEGMLDHG